MRSSLLVSFKLFEVLFVNLYVFLVVIYVFCELGCCVFVVVVLGLVLLVGGWVGLVDGVGSGSGGVVVEEGGDVVFDYVVYGRVDGDIIGYIVSIMDVKGGEGEEGEYM